MKPKSKLISSNLAVYGLAHAVVDATCAALIFSLLNFGIASGSYFIFLVIFYNILAFGLQTPIGLVTDKFRVPRFAAISGSLLTAFGAAFFNFPLLAVSLAGVGNALFHVGGGAISLNLTPKKASAPGVYVAPGAIGIFVGTLIGTRGYFASWYFLLAIAILCILMGLVKIPVMDYRRDKIKSNYLELVLLLVLLAIIVRSFVGLAILLPWKSNLNLAIALVLGVFLGKGLGGILADKFGWIKVTVGAVVISAPLLAFFPAVPVLAIVGMFLFNMTMPVTLVALSNVLPGRPGFAFGLTCLALIVGALPSLTKTVPALPAWGDFLIIIVSAVALYYGLKKYSKHP